MPHSLPHARRGAGIAAPLVASILGFAPAAQAQTPPHVLVVIADDWSYPHASSLGDPLVQTPHFDRIAAEGVLFENAFAASPSCTASRGAILAGQDAWRLGEGATLWSTLDASIPVYPDLLQGAGYHVGHERKGWSPGDATAGGRGTNPAGPKYPDFTTFLSARPAGTPFCYWLGPEDPHRPYTAGAGMAAGLNPNLVPIPPGLPDDSIVRSDLCDYYEAVQRFDAALGAALTLLEQIGELDRTLVIVTSDNGMPFPRAKANLYDTGTRVPLAVRWPAEGLPGRIVNDFVTLTDLAPTILEAAGLAPPTGMTGRSLLPQLRATTSGTIEPTRDHVVLGRERHNPQSTCDPTGYPMRAWRDADRLYIENLAPGRWPAGHPLSTWSYAGASYADVDAGPTKQLLMQRALWPALHDLAFGTRSSVELYDLAVDPGQLVDVAGLPEYAADVARLGAQLNADLVASLDPRALGTVAAFEAPPYRRPGFVPPTLGAAPEVLSVANGGRQDLALAAGPTRAGHSYVVLGSMTGIAPGFALAGKVVPLVVDPYTHLTLLSPNPVLLQGIGVLDIEGTASAAFQVGPRAIPPSMIGTRLYHAYALFDPTSRAVTLTSNACQLELRR